MDIRMDGPRSTDAALRRGAGKEGGASFFPLLLLTLALLAFAVALLVLLSGAAETGPLVIVADERELTGASAWLAGRYNDSRLGFTAMTLVLVAAVGAGLGALTEAVILMLGIDASFSELIRHITVNAPFGGDPFND